MYVLRAPRLRAASMNSRSRSDSAWPRITRAMYPQLKNPMMKISRTIRSESPESPKAESGITPASAIANTSSGNARNTSIARLTNVSTQPPKKPAITPRAEPITTDSIVAKNAISSEIRDPYTTRLKMSRAPGASTPNGWFESYVPNGKVSFGDWIVLFHAVRSESFGSWPRYLMISGAKTAIRISRTTTTAPPIATRSRLSRRHAIWPSDRPSILAPLSPGEPPMGPVSSGEMGSGATVILDPSQPVAGYAAPSRWPSRCPRDGPVIWRDAGSRSADVHCLYAVPRGKPRHATQRRRELRRRLTEPWFLASPLVKQASAL